ncbi:MAG: SPASM domain-containing protein [Tissierellia bacterium]|nr:SPASM domain-containing protein [Tissierellia bacterium]
MDMGIDHIQITLDGTERVHNNRKKSKIRGLNPYREVINSVDILIKNKIYVSLRVNVDSNNISEIININNLINVKNWGDSKFFNAYLYPVTQDGNYNSKKYIREDFLLKLVLKEINKLDFNSNNFYLDFHGIDFINSILKRKVFIPKFKFCASCSSQYVFDCKGNIYTCWWGADNPDFIIGNFRNDMIDYEKIRNWHSHDVNNIYKCSTCKYKYICGTGCVFKSYLKNGNLNCGNCSEFYNIISLYLSYLEGIGVL